MTSIDHFNLRSFDLNLLIAFDALMQERNVTKAAAKLKVQQPAMSHSLATLRFLLQDELFVRNGNVMEPTGKALDLAGPVRAALSAAQQALYINQTFDAAQESRTFRLGLSSQMEFLLLPKLAARFLQIAPGIRLHARVLNPDQSRKLLDEGHLDLLIGCDRQFDSWHKAETLFTDTLACCVNPAHFGERMTLDLETYLSLPQIVVSASETPDGCIGRALGPLAEQLNIVTATPNFLSVLEMVSQCKVMATLPASIACAYGPSYGLALHAVPAPLITQPQQMVWHTSNARNPALAWLRDQVHQVNADLTHGTAFSGFLKPSPLGEVA